MQENISVKIWIGKKWVHFDLSGLEQNSERC